MQYLDAISKMTEWSVCFHGKSFNITVIQANAPTSNAEDAEVEWFYEDLQLELTPRKRCPFHYRGLECKSRTSRNTRSKRQIWPWSMEWSRAKANSFIYLGSILKSILSASYSSRFFFSFRVYLFEGRQHQRSQGQRNSETRKYQGVINLMWK